MSYNSDQIGAIRAEYGYDIDSAGNILNLSWADWQNAYLLKGTTSPIYLTYGSRQYSPTYGTSSFQCYRAGTTGQDICQFTGKINIPEGISTTEPVVILDSAPGSTDTTFMTSSSLSTAIEIPTQGK